MEVYNDKYFFFVVFIFSIYKKEYFEMFVMLMYFNNFIINV